MKSFLIIFCLIVNSASARINSELFSDSLFSSDGPVVYYSEGKTYASGIIRDNNNFQTYTKSISKSESLSCFVDETKQGFSFKLKNKIRTENDIYPMPSKMLMISDIEGNFNGFQMILKGSGVIDSNFKWIFGKGHLVINGDMFDRGLNVTECLWLIYKLENEAENAGGKVHFIMGNHDVMNLTGDYRYLRQKYLVNADSLKIPYENWYSNNTELGRWLRGKNCIELIGNILFVHGGIGGTFPFSKFTINEINNEFRKRLDSDLTKQEIKEDVFIGRSSPIWYRGIAQNTAAPEQIDSILVHFNAEKIVLGHTIFEKIQYLYNSKVIVIDLEHKQNSDNGFMNALFFEDGNFFVINNKGEKSVL